MFANYRLDVPIANQLVCAAVILLLNFSFSVSITAAEFPDTPAGRLVAADGVLVIGHRGNARFAPENTLVSFNAAVKAGADVVELDYMVTRDGEQVVFHDKNLDRTTDAPQVLGRRKLTVADVSLDEIRRLDAGKWFDPRFRGAKVPTLAEALDLIQKDRVTMVERKTGSAEACVELLKEKEYLDKVIVQAFDWDYVADFRRLAPDAVLGALGKDEMTIKKLDQIEQTGAQLVGWNQDVSKADIDAVHARGMKIWIYTVNSEARAKKLIADGVDGIITDDPLTMVRLRNSLQK